MTTRNADTDAAIIVDEVLSFVFDLKSLQPLPMSLLIVSEVLHLNPEQCFFQCIPLTDDCVTEGCEWMKLAKHKPCITMSTMMPSASAATRYHAQCAQDLIELLGCRSCRRNAAGAATWECRRRAAWDNWTAARYSLLLCALLGCVGCTRYSRKHKSCTNPSGTLRELMENHCVTSDRTELPARSFLD